MYLTLKFLLMVILHFGPIIVSRYYKIKRL